MKKERGCLTILCVVMVAVIGAIVSFDSGNLKHKEKRQQLVDSLKIDSITIKVYKDEKN